MSSTRSSARLAAKVARDLSKKVDEVSTTKAFPTKKKRATDGESDGASATKKARVKTAATSSHLSTGPVPEVPTDPDVDTLVPAVLTFSLKTAKEHLVGVDRRFEAIFNKLPCKPYENLEQFHPFQALSTSILGQQISWLAARSITHKFKRLYDPTLPEKPGDIPAKSFPSPSQVATTDISVLRSAGLSVRKAEYIQDLAKRFADGRLSTTKILSANDDDLADMLIQVRGIGRWTVDMFAIFSLRRPDILPTGDLGVQRGLARWCLALHSPADPFSLSPKKVSQASAEKEKEAKSKEADAGDNDSDVDEDDYLPVTGDKSSHPKSGEAEDNRVDRRNELPPVFTPSITRTLREPAGVEIEPLPKTLSITELRSRISGKKKVKGALLTPEEMAVLTERWKPYRSVGALEILSDRDGADARVAGQACITCGRLTENRPNTKRGGRDGCGWIKVIGETAGKIATVDDLMFTGSGFHIYGGPKHRSLASHCGLWFFQHFLGLLDLPLLKALSFPLPVFALTIMYASPASHILYSSRPIEPVCSLPPLHDLPLLSSNSISEISELFKSASIDSKAPAPAPAPAPSSEELLLLDFNPIFLSHLSGERSFGHEALPSLSSLQGPPPGYSYNRDAERHSTKFPRGHRLNLHFVEQYQLEDELGSGGYGFVMTARQRASGREVAVKFIVKSKVPDHAWMEDELLGHLPAEVVLLHRLSHPNIIKSLDLFEDDLYFYLVQELHGTPWQNHGESSGSLSTPCLSPSASERSLDSSEPATPPPTGQLGDPHIQGDDDSKSSRYPLYFSKPKMARRASYDLFECIEQSEDRRLTESQSRHVFAQVVDAVHYLNELGISHRDIKDENLVIDRNLTVKLIDFGSACAVDPKLPRPRYEKFFGTAAYASSEILLKKKYQAAPAEVWTLGVLLSYLLTGASPFQSAREASRGNVMLYVPDGMSMSKDAVDLIRRCLNPKPESRITIQQIKKHPWLVSPVA